MIIFGVKKLNKKSIKKYGFFASILLLALNLTGCKLIPNEIPIDQNEASEKPDIIKPGSERLAKLNALDTWTKFKTFWKKLDNISPKEKNISGNNDTGKIFGEYSNSIDQAEISSLNAEMNETLKNLEMISNENLISKKEITLLNNICRERFQYMTWGLSSMVTRMAPSYFSVNRDESIKDLERKIDILLMLKKNNIINEKEFTQALENIQKDIEIFAVLDSIDSGGSYYYSSYKYGRTADISRPIESYINDFEKTYLEYQELMKSQNTKETLADKESMEQRYRTIKKDIEETKAIFPLLRELIADLEQ